MAVAMLASQAFADWHAYWWCAGAAALLALACVALLAPPSAAGASLSWRGLRQDTIDTLGTAGPVLLSLTFMLYSLMFFALFSFLPVLLMERLGLSLAQAGPTPSPPSPTLSATWGRACCWRAAGGVRR